MNKICPNCNRNFNPHDRAASEAYAAKTKFCSYERKIKYHNRKHYLNHRSDVIARVIQNRSKRNSKQIKNPALLALAQ